MKKHFIGLIVAVAAFPAITMLLWNNLLPDIFGLPDINYWQALGLLVLSKLFFSGFGGGFRRHNHRFHNKHNHLGEKWKNMSDEERQEFTDMRHHFHKMMCDE